MRRSSSFGICLLEDRTETITASHKLLQSFPSIRQTPASPTCDSAATRQVLETMSLVDRGFRPQNQSMYYSFHLEWQLISKASAPSFQAAPCCCGPSKGLFRVLDMSNILDGLMGLTCFPLSLSSRFWNLSATFLSPWQGNSALHSALCEVLLAESAPGIRSASVVSCGEYAHLH